MWRRGPGRSVACMKALLVAVVAAAAVPSVAAAAPDWHSPVPIGVAQDGVFRFPQTLATP